MPKQQSKTEKAYTNIEFLNSPDARPIRILSEFLEPMRRFRNEQIKDTIVFFGSARIRPLKDSLKTLRQLQKQSKFSKLTPALRRRIEAAQSDVSMSRYYEDAVVLSRRLTEWSKKFFHMHRFVVCSGGGPGIMEAANKGASIAGGRSIGLNISIPTEQFSNPYVSKELLFEFHYFFMRKFWFVYLAKALVMFPGGFGTLDELMEVLTLLQTGKIKKKMTVVLYGQEYWKKILNFDAMLQHRVISQADMRLFKFANTPDEAFYHLTTELKRNYPRAL
ncbi:MAG TPA: TIGR00730 family Rossman fold protein [Bacteroidota bacterium]|nr:TIGR00730 family Rossman fold protein [Bacteroidota bacterium]